MQYLEGKPAAAWYQRRAAEAAGAYRHRFGKEPELAIIQAGGDEASAMYARFMQKTAEKAGVRAVLHAAADDAGEDELIAIIQQCNEQDNVIGILLMMPLPPHLHRERIVNAIAPEKDVDGLTDSNMAGLFSGRTVPVPCTPLAVMAILDYYQIPLEGKHVVVLGRSAVVGRPVAQLCLNRHATVTICHSRTQGLKNITQTADILIAAVGKARMVTGDMIKPGAVVIDVGINRLNGTTVGDVDAADVAAVAGALTPVPGGVGAVTTTMVLENAFLHANSENT